MKMRAVFVALAQSQESTSSIIPGTQNVDKWESKMHPETKSGLYGTCVVDSMSGIARDLSCNLGCVCMKVSLALV